MFSVKAGMRNEMHFINKKCDFCPRASSQWEKKKGKNNTGYKKLEVYGRGTLERYFRTWLEYSKVGLNLIR